MNINEGYPLFIVNEYLKEYNLENLKVGILGMAFKPDVDDIRDSLSFKLKKILESRGANVLCSDEYYHESDWVSFCRINQKFSSDNSSSTPFSIC